MFDKKEYSKQWRIKNKDKIKQYSDAHLETKKEYDKKYRTLNSDKIAQYKKQYYLNNREEVLKRLNQYYINNKEYCTSIMKQWRNNNINYIKKYNKQWAKDNPEKIKEYSNQWQKNKRKTDLKFNLNGRMSNAISISLKGNKAGRHWEDLVGYTLNDLIKRLKKTMPEGYTWQDYMEGKLHIDHIIPKSIFNFTKPEHLDFQKCWALNNLQLLPAIENLEKSNKFYKPFQPALAI